MSRVALGAICGLVFAAIDVGIMLPMNFTGKRATITAAFIAPIGMDLQVVGLVCHGLGGVSV